MINNRLVFIIKDGYMLELQAPETMKLFGRTKKIIKKKKKKLVDNQCQQMFEVVYTFRPNKSYAYLLNVKRSKLVFLKAYNTVFDEIIIAFTN